MKLSLSGEHGDAPQGSPAPRPRSRGSAWRRTAPPLMRHHLGISDEPEQGPSSKATPPSARLEREDHHGGALTSSRDGPVIAVGHLGIEGLAQIGGDGEDQEAVGPGLAVLLGVLHRLRGERRRRARPRWECSGRPALPRRTRRMRSSRHARDAALAECTTLTATALMPWPAIQRMYPAQLRARRSGRAAVRRQDGGAARFPEGRALAPPLTCRSRACRCAPSWTAPRPGRRCVDLVGGGLADLHHRFV